jgi:predicted RNA polymerase sigma factor
VQRPHVVTGLRGVKIQNVIVVEPFDLVVDAAPLRVQHGLTKRREIHNRHLPPNAETARRQPLLELEFCAVQAAIAAVHDEAARVEDTDWPQIVALYGLLKRMSDNPVVTLNHAIAVAMVSGAAAGLELLKALDTDERMAGHYRLDAVRAHLLEMAGDHEAAIARYQAAAGRTASIPERNYLTTQAARLTQSLDGK